DRSAPAIARVVAHFADGTEASAQTYSDNPTFVGYNPTSVNIKATDNDGAGVDHVRVVVHKWTNRWNVVGNLNLAESDSDIVLAEHDFLSDDGKYRFVIQAFDKAENQTRHNVKVDFNIYNNKPMVLGENFNTHSGDDYKGVNVGFSIANFSEVTEV